MRKLFSGKGLICMAAIFFLSILVLYITMPDLGAVVYEKYFAGNVLVGGQIHVKGTGIKTMRISYTTRAGPGGDINNVRIDAPGSPLDCVGILGVAEQGDQIGYVTVGDDEDFLRFSIQVPDTWTDRGLAGDLEFEFYISEQATETCNIDVRIFEFNNATPIVTDTMAITNGTAAGWTNLVTLSTGIGADTDIGPGDTLVFELTATTDNDDFRIYGVRMKYAIGIERQAD